MLFTMGALSILSCSTENDLNNENAELNYQTSISGDRTLRLEDNSGFYKGIFTTEDAKYRATVEIRIPAAKGPSLMVSDSRPTAQIKLHNGEVFEADATHKAYFGTRITDLSFSSGDLSFIFSVDEEGNNPVVSNVVFKNLDAEILVSRHTQRSPVTTVTGTWECVVCNDHPYIGQGNIQTFNMMFSNPDGVGVITTQSTLRTRTHAGIGVRENCELHCTVSNTTKCEIISGDGSTTVGFLAANGKPVTWNGTHEFANQHGCTQLKGSWEWESDNYGVLSGTFEGDNSVFCCE